MAVSGIERTRNQRLLTWIEEMATLAKPDDIYWCDGSKEEYDRLCQQMVEAGTLIPLNQENDPTVFLRASDPDDVARVEHRTYVCSKDKIDAGPTNNWVDPVEMKETMVGLFDGTMRPDHVRYSFQHGPARIAYRAHRRAVDRFSYVAMSMRVMTRMGEAALDVLGDGDFVPCMHSVGAPLADGEADVPWPCNDTKYIVQYPEERAIWSYGSDMAAMLFGEEMFFPPHCIGDGTRRGLACGTYAYPGSREPGRRKNLCRRSFSKRMWKTNLAMLVPPEGFDGWKVRTVGDDIAWINQVMMDVSMLSILRPGILALCQGPTIVPIQTP